MEHRSRRGTDGLGVVDVDRGLGEHHPAGACRIGGSQHGARVSGVTDLVQQGDAPIALGEDGVEEALQSDIDEARDPDHRLWGDGGGQVTDDVVCDVMRLDPGLSRSHGERVEIIGGEQHLESPGVESLADHLGALEEETTRLLSERALA